MRFVLRIAVVVTALAFAPAALGATPPNDNRDSAVLIPTFPATIEGTTVEATLERLDPQISECGRIEATVWYRIDQAPDGTVALAVQGAGIAPVVRVYNLVKNGIQELDCATAATGGSAQIAFGTKRGASYLVVVGRKPSTPDAAFELTARLFLPPLNDTRSQAAPFGKLSTTASGSTLGATTDANDPKSCGFAGGTVWYSVKPGKATRLVLRLRSVGDLDAAVAIVRRIRSEYETVACGATDSRGEVAGAWDIEDGASYLIVVGQRKGSPPGDFTLNVLVAPPLEKAPGVHLSAAGVGSNLNWLTNANDVYWTSLTAGETYRVSFRSRGCATLVLQAKGTEIKQLQCSGYTTLTPGPDGGGRYVFEVLAPSRSAATPYRLQVARAGPDDTGVGLELANLTTLYGTLNPSGVDVVDLYNFDVSQSSDVRLRLGKAANRQFTLTLLTDSGGRLASTSGELRRRLSPGHYVAAVQGAVGSPAGRYSLGLVVRQLTQTTLGASGAEIAPGGTVTFTVAAGPPPDGGVLELQIDRLDPLTGWHFNRLVRITIPGGSVSWTPPTPGRWRAHARFLGTLRYSPSESGYVQLLVAKPLR